MKKALYAALVGRYHSVRHMRIMEVTSEKGGYRGQVYGRDEHGCPTHASSDDVMYKLATVEDAVKAKRVAAEIAAKYQPAIEQLHQEIANIEKTRDEEAEARVRGLVGPVVPA